jgi:type II secretory pathway component PulK
MPRPAFVLVVVLIVIGLLALIMAGFMFFVRAELAGAQALRDAQQARLAAESGLQEVITILRASRDDASIWFDDPELFRHVLVWSQGYDRERDPLDRMGDREELLEDDRVIPAWRFSVVAADLNQTLAMRDTMRYGITPEASKLNINTASEDEIRRLLEDVLIGLQVENWDELVDTLLDWLDEDDETRPLGAETEHYDTPELGYFPKNGPLDTIEELLLIKGYSAAVLYGEDTNRNGILDENEDDGEDSFPYYDNADGILDHGLAPYITVWSRESLDSGLGGGEQQPEGEQGEEGEEAEEGEEPEQGGENQGTVTAKINVNTAPARVLRVLDGMDAESAERIVALRREQDPEALNSLDWLVSSGALEPGTYNQVQARLTTRALQFRVEVLAYADHMPAFRRDEWIIEMRGPMAQLLYHRDLTSLGRAWPIDDETILVEGR